MTAYHSRKSVATHACVSMICVWNVIGYFYFQCLCLSTVPDISCNVSLSSYLLCFAFFVFFSFLRQKIRSIVFVSTLKYSGFCEHLLNTMLNYAASARRTFRNPVAHKPSYHLEAVVMAIEKFVNSHSKIMRFKVCHF